MLHARSTRAPKERAPWGSTMFFWILVSGLAGVLLRLWPGTAVLSLLVPGAIALAYVILAGDWVAAVAAYAAWAVGVGIGFLIHNLRN